MRFGLTEMPRTNWPRLAAGRAVPLNWPRPAGRAVPLIQGAAGRGPCAYTAIAAALFLTACAKSSPTVTATGASKAVEHVKITQFYAAQPMLPKGVRGSLCYGVEHASKLEIAPPVDDVWPSPVRCIEIAPKQKTIYTLTAYGEDGSKDTKTAEVTVGAAPPRLYDLSVNSTQVHPGDQVTVCFKVQNVKEVKASPGKFDRSVNCIMDKPRKTTTYKIVAYGGDRQEDSGTVTVKVR